DPELASVGLTEEEALRQGVRYEVYTHPFARDDRALLEGAGQGMVKILTAGWSGKIIGAHILGPRAGELIHEFVLAMQRGLTARHIADMIHVYPTLNMANQRAAQRWYQKQAERPLARWLLKLNARRWR